MIQFGEEFHVTNFLFAISAGGHAGASWGEQGGVVRLPPFFLGKVTGANKRKTKKFEKGRDCLSLYVFANQALSLANSHHSCHKQADAFS
jgi:hypothetical protein